MLQPTRQLPRLSSRLYVSFVLTWAVAALVVAPGCRTEPPPHFLGLGHLPVGAFVSSLLALDLLVLLIRKRALPLIGRFRTWLSALLLLCGLAGAAVLMSCQMLVGMWPTMTDPFAVFMGESLWSYLAGLPILICFIGVCFARVSFSCRKTGSDTK